MPARPGRSADWRVGHRPRPATPATTMASGTIVFVHVNPNSDWLTSCVKPDLYVPSECYPALPGYRGKSGYNVGKRLDGPEHEQKVKHDARPQGTRALLDRMRSTPGIQCPATGEIRLAQLRRRRWPKRTNANGHDCRLRDDGGGVLMEMRFFSCHEQRMLRALHGRWPYRRSHCRHDLHWLVRVQPLRPICASARVHSLGGLRLYSRRPSGT
jgi:hypothetical protein